MFGADCGISLLEIATTSIGLDRRVLQVPIRLEILHRVRGTPVASFRSAFDAELVSRREGLDQVRDAWAGFPLGRVPESFDAPKPVRETGEEPKAEILEPPSLHAFQGRVDE